MTSSSSSSGGSRSGGKGDSGGTAGSGQSAGPTTTQLQEKIDTLERTLSTLMRLAGRAEVTPRQTVTVPDIDPETARQQDMTRVRYEIIGGLLARRGFTVPFTPARRCKRSGVDTIIFAFELPEKVEFVILRDSLTGREEEIRFGSEDSRCEINPGDLEGRPLEPIEIYDENGKLIMLGSKLAPSDQPCPT